MSRSLDTVARAIGARVAAERAARGLTLDQLSAAAGLSRRALVNVEQGSTNPSIASLLGLSDALGIGLPALVAAPEQGELEVTSALDAPVLWRGDAGGEARLLRGTDPPDVVELWQWSLGAGDAHRSEAHAAGTQELIHLRSGALLVEAGSRSARLGEGDTLAFDGGVEHAYVNDGDALATFTLVVLEPGVGTRDRLAVADGHHG